MLCVCVYIYKLHNAAICMDGIILFAIQLYAMFASGAVLVWLAWSLVMHLGNIILGLGGFWRLQRQSISSSHATWLHDVLGPSACLVSTLWGSSTLSPQSSPLFRQVVVDSVHHGVATISEFRSYIQCLNKKQKELVWSLWGSICISS
jgi:hypothetical protein